MENNIKKKILSLLFYVVVGILVIFIIFEVVFPKYTVKVFGFKPYTVITRSMEPIIMENDLIFVTNPKLEELNKDDIITFSVDIYNDGVMDIVTHYIYSVELVDGERVYKTNGHLLPVDAWELSDEDILGEYGFRVHFLGKIIEFIRSPFGIAAIVVNIGVIIAIVYLLKSSKTEVEKAEEIKEDK